MLLVGRADAGWTPPSGSDSESVPVLNHKEAALGITITFTVRNGQLLTPPHLQPVLC